MIAIQTNLGYKFYCFFLYIQWITQRIIDVDEKWKPNSDSKYHSVSNMHGNWKITQKTTGVTQEWFCFMKFSTVRLFVCMPFQSRTKTKYENYKQQQDTESKKRTDEWAKEIGQNWTACEAMRHLHLTFKLAF